MKNKFDTFYDAMMLENIVDDALFGQAGSEEQFNKDIEETGAVPEDAEGTDNITGELNGNARQAADAINNIFALVEDKGQEMLDMQAAEKLEDIIELASNALRELKLRLD
jgi:hypothetical protein